MRNTIAQKSTFLRVSYVIPMAVVAFLVWAMTFDLVSTVRASGIIVSNSQKQIVSHKEGGVLAAMLVREGEKIDADADLLIIDNLAVKEELDILSTRLLSLQTQISRLRAESNFEDFELSGRSLDPIYLAERQLFGNRKTSLQNKLKLLRQQRDQKAESILQLERSATVLQR